MLRPSPKLHPHRQTSDTPPLQSIPDVQDNEMLVQEHNIKTNRLGPLANNLQRIRDYLCQLAAVAQRRSTEKNAMETVRAAAYNKLRPTGFRKLSITLRAPHNLKMNEPMDIIL